MFSIIKFIIVLYLSYLLESKPVSSSKCSPSMLGCSCQDLEIITEKELEPCCSKKLENLIITGHNVKNISVNIEKSKCAKNFLSLLITETGLMKFYSPFRGLNNVSSVNIEKNQNLSDFHTFIFYELNPDIVNIYVELNSFRTISKKTFANLTKLTSLRLSDNKIGFIEDQSFSGLKNLSLLYMNNNILTLLNSEVFFGLESLTVLNLMNNPLQEPKSDDLFKHLKKLRYLMMSHGTNVELPGISQLPPRIFYSVKQLRTLNITNIRIKTLVTLTFYGLNELERLDLQSNKLTTIPSGVLQQVPKIGSINLSKNQLTCLRPDTFQNLPKLTNLDISQNDLSYISGEVFKDLGKLQTLDLSENNIYVIDKNAFVGLHSLMIFKLNVIHGRAKNEIQTKFYSSPLAKLRNTTKIIGLMEYFGVSKGDNQQAELPEVYSNGSIKISDRKNMECPVASISDKDWVDFNTTGSRKYLLIIVGICVVFLLVAFTIIMTYRAWSKRRMGEMALADDIDEKQEMLQSKGQLVNGRLDKPVSKSNHHVRKSINGGSGHDKTAEVMNPQQRHSNSQLVKTVNPSTTISDGRSHSDDESALTPLGVL